jgi:hypothetical protein
MQFKQFQLFKQTKGDGQNNGESSEATDQRRQTSGDNSMAIDRIGQQQPMQKLPPGQQLKKKWSKEKRDA